MQVVKPLPEAPGVHGAELASSHARIGAQFPDLGVSEDDLHLTELTYGVNDNSSTAKRQSHWYELQGVGK